MPAAKISVSLPNNGWTPRADQMPLWNYLRNGGKRADVVAHRRWGKDEVGLHSTAVAAHERVGNYWHMLPEQQQARKAIWDAVNPRTGKKRIDEAFPVALRKRTLEDEMFIEFKNGSTWQVLGSDAYDKLVGTTPIGVVFSEWSLSKPKAWQYIRPILMENGGWAMFIWTPRGRNHATRAFEMREKDPEWFTARMPASKTNVFTPEQLAKEKAEIIAEAGSILEGEALYEQEYEVSFDAPVPGSYYGEQMRDAEAGYIRITDSMGRPKMDEAGKLLPPLNGPPRVGWFPHDPKYPVETAWDLGIDDYTAIWFFQRRNADLTATTSLTAPIPRIRVIDFYETADLGFEQIKAECFDAEERDAYRYSYHNLPHDVMVRELGAGGRSRKESLESLGIKPIRVGVKHKLDDGIAAVRRLLPFVEFNLERAESGVEHMKGYAKKYNAALGIYTGEDHGPHSHAADAFREIAFNVKLRDMAFETKVDKPPSRWDILFAQQRKGAKGAKWKVV